ncbi:hypothetical protein CCR75_008220 [Bremia lactucae]|uniref:Transmembrane protein n=1 Tax=Bremia lactucae TaxID=4779 RepID=A0A976IFX7_BRELC|nr:hypothetical protein CCR75_008220 [Bremia lactucae]
MPSERSSRSYSFISEGSFCIDETAFDWDRIVAENGVSKEEFGLKVLRDLRTPSFTVLISKDDTVSGLATSKLVKATTNASDSELLDFEKTWMDSEIPMVGRSSSAPPSIQLLQEVRRPSERIRATTAPPTSFFNHLLYGSLRAGTMAKLFSQPYCGLAVSAAATGFMIPFLVNAFQPLLCVYLSFNNDQCIATVQCLKFPGVLSFFIGLLSDLYPIWSFHRKSYMLLGWIFAYMALMALVTISSIDENTNFKNPTVRTFYGGVVYILLMMATSLGVTMASIVAFAFLVELSQREPIHERGKLMLQYLLTQEAATLFANIVISCVVGYNDKYERTESVISIKMILLIMAIVTLVPIPAVLFRLGEEPRQLRVDSVDRLLLARHLWNILQQQAVWRILLFVCTSVLLSSFQFHYANNAVLFWAHALPTAERVGAISTQASLLLSMVVFQVTLFNYSWVRLSIGGLILGVIIRLIVALPTIFNGLRSAWFILSILSFNGVSYAAVLLVTTLPLVEITENCLEGATTGFVASFTILARMAALAVSDAIRTSSPELKQDFSKAVIVQDSPGTRKRVLCFVMANCAINLLALAPILYLLPRQKLEAQEMRTYGGSSRLARIAIIVLFVGLITYTATVNVYAFLN